MVEINANIRLRPIRIGFLVRPNDLASVQEVMRYCAAVWGGVYNPIIPVFSKPPKSWASDPFDRVRGIGVAKGYIRFFEPDVYVEAEKGLLELVGLGAVRDRLTVYPDVLTLSELLKPEKHKDWCEPAFGLNIQDVQAHLYRTDQQFTKRDQHEKIIVEAERGSGIAELIFGVFPTQKSVGYIARGYKDAFQPTKLSACPASWEKAFKEHALTPLRVTGYGLNNQRYWYHDTIIFVFDPRRATDLIDAWNLRLEPHPVVPVPVDWFEALGDSIFDLIKSEHRRIQGNPQNGIVTPLRACGPAGGSVAKGMKKISYRGYRFPPEIIQQAIWLYLRFTLSLRDVEDLLAERGIMVSYETVRRWVNHFGPMIAADLRKRRPKPHTTWHLDEVYLKIAGRMVYLWRAVDAEGEVLDVLVQSRRNKRAALKLMRKLLKKYGFVPDKLVTDDLRSYAAAASDLGITRRHERGRWRNNRAENSHPDDENTRCRVSSVRGQPKDFSQLTQPPTTLSTSNVISLLQGRTEPFARRL